MHQQFVLTYKYGKKIGDEFGRIIWNYHGTGVILHFAGSDGSICTVQVSEEFECCGLCKNGIFIGYNFNIIIMECCKYLLLEGIIKGFGDTKLHLVYLVLAHKFTYN